MNDVKNLFLAWISAGSPFIAAIGTETSLTILTAIVLPVLFFAVGKTADICLQIYFRNRDRRPAEKEKNL